MTNTVLLDTIAHADLRVAIGHAARFGDAVNQCVVFPTEFEAAQRDYPIVFRRDAEGSFYAVALLGLDRDENLFLDPRGWDARHIPALHQRGPFLIGMVDRDGVSEPEPMLHVDLDHARIGATDGQPVFLPHGGQSPYLDHIVKVLRVIHDGIAMRAPMFAAFEQAELIEPVTLDIALDEETHYSVPDCFTIGPERLARLDAAALDALHRAGFLQHAFLVASSLGNVTRLIELKNRKRRAG
ncbi:SapC family protein [Sphingomonas sp. 10B4]|uniref:SapC family protein n=1 Tax=Sphingomonas sp. 10B4 TaxID=3048575 RepID=UPI002AB5D7A4|nr:SapC family protein [Sphingomonas sp. 10B4]MDY7524407.1 SapC family protein [Sphingomonas sp. 10B4]MEB0283525.1 SapC family protein [Sphingomonas sp. 10B4]